MLYPDLMDIPFELFGGYVPAIPPSDLSPGAAAICQDMIFPQGGLRTRGGLQNFFSVASPIPANASINGLKSYLTPNLSKRLLAWDSLGNFYKEAPQATLSLLFSRPYTGLFYESQTLFGREYQAFFNSLGGFDIPRQYDDTFWDRVSQVGPGVSPSAVDSASVGNIAAGKHQVSVAFITRQGFITQAAPPTTWTAAGTKQVALTNIAIGPPNIVARLILFTPVITPPATTGSFYSLPNGTTQLATPTLMLINDNTTTSTTLDFTDAILIAGFSANYLFTQAELGESAFTIGYNSRLVWMGERNKIGNFVNLTFDGGFSSGPASANVGPNNPSVATDGGGGNTVWQNPNNIFAIDGVLATNGVISFSASDPILATGYGFAIPATATPVGIVVTAKVKASVAGQIADLSVKILKAGVATGTDHASYTWPTALTNQLYGNSGDLWGVPGGLTAADINNAGFGVSIQVFNNDLSTLRTASIDWIGITVYYTTPATGATPLGWTAGASFAGGGSALAGMFAVDWADAFAITGDGATAIRGQITQAAYQDYLLTPIIVRNTAYRVRARVAAAGGLAQGALHINLQSTIGAFTSPGIVIQANQLSGTYKEFDAPLTTAIVSPQTDLLLQVYADGTPTNGGVFLVDSIEIYPTSTPFNYSMVRFSHAFNPESYDATTGAVQIRPNDGTMLRAAFPLRNNLYFAKDHYLCYVADDGVNEPSSWAVNEVSATVGICGPNAVDWNEEWAIFAERSGLYICWGSDPVKITPEIQIDASGTGKISWASIDWTLGHTVWVRIDKVNKMILVGVPLAAGGRTTFMVDYRWLENAQDIASAPLVTYSNFTGKILSHGRGRRWSLWNITANSMTFAERADGTVQPFFGNGSANGKIYQQLDCATQPSDDGAAIPWQYQGYGCPSGMEEQMLQLGAHRKLLGYMKWRAIGVGLMPISVSTAQRTTLLRSYALSLTPTGDGERPLNVHGERFFPMIGKNTVAGNWCQVEKLILCVRKDAAIPVRGMSA